ncbi:sugar transferase [Cylindrospermum sp. FACHB-282]|uniref:sugar transferase n=1 Tax=Cylindrospermum sp. FACHB-282 TaxID=2692794 RepID=UPI0016854758|nr:sugar transferase [Cylindrospermum sp. FACHB-282]MBD2387486.1 sugar transferase [Cylindrospermum sp. FACHB-282]
MKASNLQSHPPTKISRFIKSVLDRVVAAIALIMFSPLVIGVAIAIYLNIGRPVIFAQQRPGKDCQLFTCYKFRTMTDERDNNGNLLPDAERLTNLGTFLRKTSLDELPQLWSVLKGDMSFVGPRPLLVQYLPYYSEREGLRHSVLPGITGLAQINGRNRLQWEARLELDVQYVENQSLALDIYILFMTVWKVIARSDIDTDTNQEGNFAKSRQKQLGLPVD